MNKKSIAIISSVLILTLMGCSGETSDNSASSEISITKVDMNGSDAKAEADTAQTDSIEMTETKQEAISPKKLDASFTCNGNTISVLNDTETTLKDLGDYDSDLSCLDQDYKNYVYSADKIQFDTAIIDGKELPVILYVSNPEIKTSKNIGIGNTENEVIDAYGFPNEKTEEDSLYMTVYHFSSYDLIFDFDSNKEHVEMIRYKNTKNYSKVSF